MPPIPELTAFTEECRATEATLAAIDPARWSGPGLGRWNLHELVAHLVGGAARLAEYAAEAVPPADKPLPDRVAYWQMDLRGQAPAIAERARQRAAELDPTGIPEAFAAAWRRSAAVVAARAPDQPIATLRGAMRTDEYLATRVLEVVVHHLDVRAAVDLPPTTTPHAGRIVMSMLEGLLGGPRPRNLGRNRFIMAATGRVEVDDPRFPVLT